MWEWLHRRRRLRRQGQSSRRPNQAGLTPDPVINPDLTRPIRTFSRQQQPFFVPSPIASSPPKCISQLPCSQILYGERVEDFSTDCWLENHLHRFGCPMAGGNPTTSSISSPIVEETDDSITSSSSDAVDSDRSTLGFSDIDSFHDVNSDNDYDISNFPSIQLQVSRRRLALEDLFTSPLLGDEAGIQLEMVPPPPPYSQFPEDPPPTYEEAIGALERRSNSTRSSSLSSTMFMW